MNYFLTFQNTYDQVEIGLFLFKPALLARVAINKQQASKELIPILGQFLQQNNHRLSDFPFIVVNQGPGPFTTLRTVITSANGLSFATGIPLIGVDALQAARAEWHDQAYPYTVIMFNAFAFDVYVLIEQQGTSVPIRPTVIFKGSKNIDVLLEDLKKSSHEPIRFIGNGATMYHQKIKEAFGDQAIIPELNPDYCSLEQIGLMGYAQWHHGNKGVRQLLPLYLKQHPVQLG